jgi:ketopantoate hydroxymethyltransferase
MTNAVKDYISEVQDQSYPSDDFSYGMDETILDKIKESLN